MAMTGGPGSSGGRPYGSSTSHRETAVSAFPQAGLGWLLRVTRVYAGDDRWFKLRSFASAFHGGSYPSSVDPSTISRWERGTVPVTFLALRRYEELLEMPRNALVSTVEMTARYYGGAVPGSSSCQRPKDPRASRRDQDAELDTLERLLDLACSTAVMTGGDWDALCRALASLPHLVLMPRGRWDVIAGRLLAETIIAAGHAWRQRFEAFNRLLDHPVGRRAAIAACASLAKDRGCQIFVEPISALEVSDHPDASSHVLAQIEHPTNERVQYGALRACHRKLRQSHLSPSDLNRLGAALEQLLSEPLLADDARLLTADLVQRLNPTQPVARRLQRMTSGTPLIRGVLESGRLAGSATAELAIGRIVDRVRALQTPNRDGFEDHMLPLVVDQMLYHPNSDVRMYAAAGLAITPYRPALAAAIAEELGRPSVLSNALLSDAFLWALRHLGGPPERPLVESLIAGSAMPTVAAAAASVIGHMEGTSADRFWGTEVTRYADIWRRTRSPSAARTLHGLIYALGINRHQALLSSIANGPHYPAMVRAAAAWWRDTPGYIALSAAQA